MQIRPAGPSDGEAIRAIYNSEILNGTNTFDLVPLTSEEQQEWLLRHVGAHPAIVATSDEGTEILGFGSLSPYRTRPAYATTVENSVYVDPDHRGAGVGKELLNELVRLASAHGFHAVIARIVGQNEASIRLHTTCGFQLVGTEREVGRKHGQWLDVVELQRLV